MVGWCDNEPVESLLLPCPRLMSQPDPPARTPPAAGDAPPALPAVSAPPRIDVDSSEEMQAWIAKLKRDERKLGRRNRVLTVALAAGVILLVAILAGVHHATVGAYAVLDRVAITRRPASQGRLDLAFRVRTPGKVFYRRTSGSQETELVDYFHATGPVRRSWSWVYQPGRDINVAMTWRGRFFRRRLRERFPTAATADIVVLIDTTGSMDPSIDELKQKCVLFSRQLTRQALAHRFALVGFGDVAEGEWLDRHEFTSDPEAFRRAVAAVRRFDGGDLDESALDALEAGLSLPLEPAAMRRFYLVTDAGFHEPAQSGATAAEIARRLAEGRVHLEVFSRPQFAAAYRTLLGSTGRFQEIENFGKVLSEGRVLED